MVWFENIAAVAVAIMVEMVVDRSMGGGKFLQGLSISERRHGALSPPEWLRGIFRSIVEPAPTFLIGGIADYDTIRENRPPHLI